MVAYAKKKIKKKILSEINLLSLSLSSADLPEADLRR